MTIFKNVQNKFTAMFTAKVKPSQNDNKQSELVNAQPKQSSDEESSLCCGSCHEGNSANNTVLKS